MASSQARRRLGVVYHQHSVDPLQLAAAFDGEIEVVWLVEPSGRPRLAPLEPLLRRLGTVAEVRAGRAAADAADLGLDGVVSFAEHLPLAAEVAEGLGLPYHGREAARRLSDKAAQREAFAAAGLPGPPWWPVPTGAAAQRELAGHLPYPVVLKPREGIGSRRTFRIEGADELLAEVAGCRPDAWIVEGLIAPPGPAAADVAAPVTVETLVLDGVPTHLALRGAFTPAPPFRVSGSFVPADLDGGAAAEVEAAATTALAALGVGDGFCNTELIRSASGVVPIEVNGRLGGQLTTLWEMVGGTSLLRAAAEVALGAHPDRGAICARGPGVPFCWYLQPPMEARRLESLDGVDEVAAMPGVRSISHHLRPGEAVDWRIGNGSRVATVLGVADDHDDLRSTISCIRSTLRPGWSDGAGAQLVAAT